jgi:hypothetical protein
MAHAAKERRAVDVALRLHLALGLPVWKALRALQRAERPGLLARRGGS